MEVESSDYKDEKYRSRIHYVREKAIFGYEQMEDNNQEFQMVVMDSEKDLLAIYRVENGKKVVQAIPNMMRMANTFGTGMVHTSETVEALALSFEKTGKTKTFAGYKCHEYIGEDEEEKYKFYVADDFPISWMDSYGEFVKNYMSANYSDMSEIAKGMVMYSQSEIKKNNRKSTWEVKKVNTDKYSFNNSEWELRKLGE